MSDGVDAGRAAAAMREDFPAFLAGSPRIDRGDDALAAEPVGNLRDDVRAGDGGAVHGHLVRAGKQQGARVLG